VNATTSTAIANFRNIVTLKDGAGVLFRPMTADDYEALVKLFVPLSQEDRETVREDITTEVIRSWVDTLNYDRVLPIVAEVRKEVIGEGTLHYGRGAHRHLAEVRIFLAKAWRRRGVGSKLLQTMISIARRQGLRLLKAEIVASHIHVIKAFQAQGFEVVATLDDYFMLPDGHTTDTVLMINTLIGHVEDF
jgi:L-amino acid N-acyltransferase YncA